jgi:hypothetical protein
MGILSSFPSSPDSDQKFVKRMVGVNEHDIDDGGLTTTRRHMWLCWRLLTWIFAITMLGRSFLVDVSPDHHGLVIGAKWV